MTFDGKMKIGKGQKYDVNQVSKEGLSEEDLAQIKNKNKKMIDIYNVDGQEGLSALELSRAMDGFQLADTNNDGELSRKELKAWADKINKENLLEGDNAVSFRDLKRFLKDITKATKGHEKGATADIRFDGNVELIAEEKGWTPVEGQARTFADKDGRAYIADQDQNMILRAKYYEKSKK